MPLLWQCTSWQQSQYRSCVQLLLTLLQCLALHCPCLPPATRSRRYLHRLLSPAEEGAVARSSLMSFSLSFEAPASSQSGLEYSVGNLYVLEGERMTKQGAVGQDSQRRWTLERSQCSDNHPALQHPPSELILKRSWFLHEIKVTALERPWPFEQKI